MSKVLAMKIGYTVAVAAAALMLGASSPGWAGNVPGGNGSTGNPGTNNPAKVNNGSANMDMMDMMHGKKALPRCTSKRTHNCRHVSHHTAKSM
jgi:hypothetical protein